MKIAVIGGGSTYTPELIEGFLQSWENINLNQIALYDINAERQQVVADFCRRMAKHKGAGFEIVNTTDLNQALEGASFVLFQLRVGGQEARHQDILLGLRHNLIGQETTGVGGFAKALRTIPVVLKIAEKIEQTCPKAWIVNFTNPSGIITEALLRQGFERTVGLCNIPIGMQMEIASALGVEPTSVRLDYAGLNHLSFVRHVYVNGKDRIDEIISMLEESNLRGAPANIEDMEYPPGFLRMLGALPSPYLRYFYLTNTMLKRLKAKPLTRAQEVMQIEKQLLEYYANEQNHTKPEMLSKRGGAFYSRIAVKIVESLLSEHPTEQIVITAAKNAFPGIEPSASVEIPALLSSNGVEPIALKEPLPPHLFGLVAQVKAYETLTVEAAVERNYNKAWQALVVHPLCGAEKARQVLDDILRTFKEFLQPYGWQTP